MKYLTQEEMKYFVFKKSASSEKQPNPMREKLLQLEIGQAVLVSKDEWTLKSSPSTTMNSWFVKKKDPRFYSVRTLNDESGWVIIRTK